MKRAKDQLKSNIVLGLESSSSRMSNLRGQQMYFGRFFGVDEITQEIEAVTPAEGADDRAAVIPAGGDGTDTAEATWAN